MKQVKITICDGEKVKAAISILYDYLVFSSHKEIDEECSRIKTELFQMLKYSSEKELKKVIDSLRNTFKNVPSIFENNDCELVIKYVNNYLNGVKKGNIEISKLSDFELLVSYASLVVYL